MYLEKSFDSDKGSVGNDKKEISEVLVRSVMSQTRQSGFCVVRRVGG